MISTLQSTEGLIAKASVVDPPLAQSGRYGGGHVLVGLVLCPAYGKKLRWPYHYSGEVICPVCRLELIVLVKGRGRCFACLQIKDSFAAMVCDWVDPEGDEDDTSGDQDRRGQDMEFNRT